jgi:murein tripeptide amidase MpaA
LDQRRLDLITITSYRTLLKEKEDLIMRLFPLAKTNMDRPNKSKKPTIFISARVHPGEVPSSFVMNGILDFLTRDDDPQTMALLDNFVFKIIPMLNPDGVVRGHYRLDNLG